LLKADYLYKNMNRISIFLIVLVILFIGGYAWQKYSNRSIEPTNESTEINNEVSGNIANQNLTNQEPDQNNDMKEKFIPQAPVLPAIILPNGSHVVTVNTNKGMIKFETYDKDAPLTVTNFINLAEGGYYNGLIFHRVIKGFMIQGGDPTGTGSGDPGYRFADELNQNTESYKNGYKKGIVAMANAGSNTNGSQFFIMTETYPLPNNYTIFGNVIEGQEIVDAIANVTTGTADRPVDDVIMEKVTVEIK